MKLNKFFSLAAALVLSTMLSAKTLNELIPADVTNGTVIPVPAGTYEPSDLTDETRTLIFQAEEKGTAILDGSHNARCADLSDTITLDGFIIQNGSAECGGGVRGGTVINSTIKNCSADFGGGTYKTHVRASILVDNTAEFFGLAAYGGTMMSCRVEGNTSATYGGGMAALFGVTVANTAVTGNNADRDFSGALASSAQNMIFLNNTATKGLYKGAPTADVDVYGGNSSEGEAYRAVSGDASLFKDPVNGNYDLNLTETTEATLKEQGDATLGGNYDALWYNKDLAGRPRLLGSQIDIGPYEIAETFTVECLVEGVGDVTLSQSSIQEGDSVTFTATKREGYARDFDGFYVNGVRITSATTMTYAPVADDRIVARFKGLEATPATLENILTQLHPETREVVTLANGAYTIANLDKAVVFSGTSIDETIVTATADQKESVFVNVTVKGTPTNATIHRSLITAGCSGANLTITSSVITSDCTTLSGKAANVTVYGTLPSGLSAAAFDCLVLDKTPTNPVAEAILAEGDATNIDAGANNSGITPYDAFDIGGRPRVMGTTIDKGAHECHYITLTVKAEGHFTTLAPEVGTTRQLAGNKLELTADSPRPFKGWTLEDGTKVDSPYTLPEEDVTLTATFAGFDLTPETAQSFDFTQTTKDDTITLAAGTYAQAFNTPATIVGTGDQDEVILSGTVTGGAIVEAVKLTGKLGEVTLNRCRVETATMADGGSVTATNSIFINSTVSGSFTNNTFDETNVTATTNVNNLTAEDGLFVEDYQLVADASAIDADTATQNVSVGDIDYYGNPRVNNEKIDLGAAEYQWPPHVVTINVIGHGLVSPRGEVEVVRGSTLTFTAKEDPAHPRGEPTVKAGEELLEGVNGQYTIDPEEDMTVTVTFTGITVGPSDKDFTDLAAAVAEAQTGDTITVEPGIYGAIDVKGKAITIVASATDPKETIIDAGGLTRAVTLAKDAEIIGFTIQNGVASEGAGVHSGTVRRCIIKDNKLSYNGTGAGICNVELAESCLIYDNGSADVARSNGGGAANSDLLNCTIARNIASTGAGLYECTAKNCVVALNTDLAGASSDWYGDSVTVDSSTCCTPTTEGSIQVEADAIFVNPDADDWRLRAGVSCIDAGVEDARLSPLDVAGVERPYNGKVDMGALEWNAPNYEITIAFRGRGQVTAAYDNQLKTVKWSDESTTFSIPRTIETITFTWTSDSEKDIARTFKGLYINDTLISETATEYAWEIAVPNTVQATLTFVANDIAADATNIADVLTDAIAGEKINLAAGTYADQLVIGEDVTVVGAAIDTVILAGGAALADGAVLERISATAPIVGPETEGASAELRYAMVYDVTEGAAVQNLVVKTALIRDNVDGVANSTVYLSTIVNNSGVGASESTVYGSVFWKNGANTDDITALVDCYKGDTPSFTLPYPDGDDYTLMGRSPLIDLAGTPSWEGFVATDFATDLAGKARPKLFAYDVGAYEYQSDDLKTNTWWTWYGGRYTVDGNIGDAAWTRMKYGAPQQIAEGDDIYFADRTGFTSATIGVDKAINVGTAYWGITRELNLVDAGGLLMANLVSNNSSGTLNLAAPLMIGNTLSSTTGAINILEGARILISGTWQNGGSMPVTISGGFISTEQSTFNGSATLTQTGGEYNFGSVLNVRDSATLTFAGGTVTGGELSVARTSSATMVRFTGADVTLSKIETGDIGGARYGDIEQTGGTVTITATGTGKNAPLHISHWRGESHYYLKGGELIVPNSEVRLGTDGTGYLKLYGGVAKLKSVAIGGGAVHMEGGTYHALATQTLTAYQYGSSTYEAADGTVLTLNLTTTAGTTTKLASGKFKMATVPTNVNLTLGKNVALEGNVALGAYTLTLPGNGAATLTGDYTVGSSTIIIDPETAPALGEKTAVLTVSGTITGDPVSAQPDYYTFSVEEDGDNKVIYVTLNTALPETTTVTTPTITVEGDTTWADGSWSSAFVAEGPAVVKAEADAILTIDAAVTASTLTFDVPEGITLTVASSATITTTTLVKTGLGTLRLETPIAYTTFTSGEGILEMAAEQTLAGTALNTMAVVADADITITDTTTLDLVIADGKTVTLAQTEGACTGTIVGEGNAIIDNDYVRTFTGTLDVAGTLTCTGAALTLVGDVAVDAIEGTYALGTLNSLYLGSGTLELNTTLADCFEKSGAGSVTLTSSTVYSGSIALGGPVTITEAETIKGALHLKEGATMTMPYNCTWNSTGEIRVEPTVTFVLTGTPATGTYTLLKSQTTVGLQTDNLASLSVAWADAPASLLIPKLALQDSALVYTVTAPTALVWTGTTDTDWSGTGNWSGNTFADGNAVAFNATSAGEKTTITVSQTVAPSVISIESGVFTVNGTGSIVGNVTVTQAAGSTMNWNTFIKEGVYTVYKNATANLAINGGWRYNGHFVGEGKVVVATGTDSVLTLASPSVGFTGSYVVASGAVLQLQNAEAAYNAKVDVSGTLAAGVPTTLRAIEMKSAEAVLQVGVDAPLVVRESVTGYNDTVKVKIAAMPTFAGDWEVLRIPADCQATFELADKAVTGYATFLSRTDDRVYLSIRPDTDIAWGKNMSDAYAWVINGTKQTPTSTANKNVYLNDLADEAAVETTVPAAPLTLTVTSVSTKYTLTGSESITSIAPLMVTLPTLESALVLQVSATPTAVDNDGTLTVSGNGTVLDLTKATLSGHGRYVAAEGATIRITAQILAETTATFIRGGGTIQVVVDENCSLPDGNYPTGSEGSLIKSGDGTLYITPTALSGGMTILDGSVVMTGAAAIKARYVKFEAHARFAGSASGTPTGLADFVTTMNGKPQDWPKNAEIVRFDSGVTNKVQIGVTGDSQKVIAADCTGEVNNLFDNDPSTQFIWKEWHNEYGIGGKWTRNYFVIDTGADGLEFTGYNIATPASLPAFFYKWDVSVSNDISAWRPGSGVSTDLSNENTVWQDIDVRENSNSYATLAASSWMSIGGYTARKLSGLYSNLPGAITIEAGAELNLEKLAGTTGILPDIAEVASVTGEGTLTIPSNLTLKAGTIDVGTLQLAGSAPLKAPLAATTTLTFDTLKLTDAYVQALVESGSTEFLVVDGFSGETPKIASDFALADGMEWATAIVKGDLYLYLVSSSDVYVTVSGNTVWSGIAWQNAAGGDIEGDIDWATVKSITVRVNGSAILSGLPVINTTEMPALTAFNVDFGYTPDKPILTLASTNAVTLPALVVKGQAGGCVKADIATLSIGLLNTAAPYNGIGVSVMNALTSASYAYSGSGVLALLEDCQSVVTKKVTVARANPLEIASGTVKPSFEDNFGGMVCAIRINSGATLDLNGTPISNDIVLAGGTLTNTGAAIGSNKRQTYNITLTDDSVIAGTGDFMSLNAGWGKHTLTLNGHTLTKSGSNTFSVCNATIQGDGGTICVKQGKLTFFKESQNPSTVMQELTLRVAQDEEGLFLGEIEIARDYAISGTLTLDGSITIDAVLSDADTAAPGCLTVTGGDVALYTAPTYTGLTTVAAAARFGAVAVAGPLTFEAGAIFKPVSTTAMTVGGTLTSTGTEVNLSLIADDASTEIPLIATGCDQTLTKEMVATTSAYTPSVTGDTIYYTYVDLDGAYYWKGGASGNWEAQSWILDGTGNNTYLPGSSKVTFTENDGEITLSRGSILFTVKNISPVKVITIPQGVTLKLPEPARVDYALTINGVTLVDDTSKLVMYETLYASNSYATTLGDVAGGAGTFTAPAVLLDRVGTINVGTLEISGSALPSTGPGSLTCKTVKLSDELVSLIQSSTSGSQSAFVIAQSTAMTEMPALVDADGNSLADYRVAKGDDGKLYITVIGDASVTELKATVSGTATWSGLAWTTVSGTPIATPAWSVVEKVTLTAAADATVTLDVNVPALRNLVTAGAYELALTSTAGARLSGTSGGVNLSISGTTLKVTDVLDAAAFFNAMSTTGSSGTLWIANAAVTQLEKPVYVSNAVKLKVSGDLAFAAESTLNTAGIEILSGTTQLATTTNSIAGSITVAKGATLKAMSDDALAVAAAYPPPTVTVNGTLDLDGVCWTISGWSLSMGEGAVITGSGASVDGETLALNFAAPTFFYVNGAGATLSAPMGSTSNDILLQVLCTTASASLNWSGATSSTIFNVSIDNYDKTNPGTLTMSGAKASKGLLTIGTEVTLAPSGSASWAGSVTFAEDSALTLGDTPLYVGGRVSATQLEVTLPANYAEGTPILTSANTLSGDMLAVKDTLSGSVSTDANGIYALSYKTGVIEALVATVSGDITAWNAEKNITWFNVSTYSNVEEIDEILGNETLRKAVSAVTVNITEGTASVTDSLTTLFPNAEVVIAIESGATYALATASDVAATATITGSGTIQKLGAGTLDLTGATMNNFTGSLDVDAGTLRLAQGQEISVTGASIADGAKIAIKLNAIAAYTAGSGLNNVSVTFLAPDGEEVASDCVSGNTFTPISKVYDGVEYTYFFRGTDGASPADPTVVANWYTTNGAYWTQYADSLTSLQGNFVIDGRYIVYAADAESGKKTVVTMGACSLNSASLGVYNDVSTTVMQLSVTGSTLYVDDTSAFNAAYASVTEESSFDVYVKSPNGFVVTYGAGDTQYRLYEEGSVTQNSIMGAGTHTIQNAIVDLGVGAYAAREATSRTLIAYDSAAEATFARADGAVTATDGTPMTQRDSVAELRGVGDYALVQEETSGLVLYYLKRSEVPSVYTWTGASSADWSTAANWDVGAVPTAGADVMIPAGATVSVDAAAEVASITFAGDEACTDATVLTGSAQVTAESVVVAAEATVWTQCANLSGALTNAGTIRWMDATLAVSEAILKGHVQFLGTRAGESQTLTLAADVIATDLTALDLANVTQSGEVLNVSAAAVTILGDADLKAEVAEVTQTAGTLTGTISLAATAEYTLSGGTLTASLTATEGAALTLSEEGVLATSLPENLSLTVTGGTIAATPSMTIPQAITVSEDKTLTIEVAAGNTVTNTTFAGGIAGAGALVKSGAGELNLPAYTGSVEVAEGSLRMTDTQTSAVYLASTDALLYVVLSTDETKTFTNITLASGVGVENVRFVTTSGKVVKAMGVSGAVVYTDKLYAAADGNLWSMLTWTMADDTPLASIDWASITAVELSVSEDNIPVTIDADISGITELSVTGSGSAVVALQDDSLSAWGITAGTSAGSGTLAVAENVTVYLHDIYADDAKVTFSGVTKEGDTTVGKVALMNPLGDIVLKDNLALSVFEDMTLSGVISGTGSLTVENHSTLMLTAVNTFTGATTVPAGSVIGGNGTLAGTLTFEAGAALDASAGALIVEGAVTLPASGTLPVKVAPAAGVETPVLICATTNLNAEIFAPSGINQMKVVANTDKTAFVLSSVMVCSDGISASYESIQASVDALYAAGQNPVMVYLSANVTEDITLPKGCTGLHIVNMFTSYTYSGTVKDCYGTVLGTADAKTSASYSTPDYVAEVTTEDGTKGYTSFNDAASVEGATLITLLKHAEVAESLTVAVPIAGAYGITVTSGALTLTAENTYTGSTTVASGAALAGTGTIAGNVVFANGATLDTTAVTAENRLSVIGTVTQEGALTVVVATDATAGTTVLTCGSGSAFVSGQLATSGASGVVAQPTAENTALSLVATVCTVGTTAHASLEAALADPNAYNGTITLTAGVTLSKTLVIDVGAENTVTINLNGNSLMPVDADMGENPTIRLQSGTLKLTTSSYAMVSSTNGIAILAGASDNTGTKSESACVLEIGTGVNITSSDGTAVKVVAGTIKGEGSIITSSLTLENGATIDATANPLNVSWMGSVVFPDGTLNVKLATAPTEEAPAQIVQVTNATTSEDAYANVDTVSVTVGDSDASTAYKLAANDAGYFVAVKPVVCKDGNDASYYSIQEAVDANAGKEAINIVLTADSSENVVLPENCKSFVIYPVGATFSGTVSDAYGTKLTPDPETYTTYIVPDYVAEATTADGTKGYTSFNDAAAVKGATLITLLADVEVTGGTAESPLVVDAPIAGDYGITVTSGAVTFSGANTYAGGTVIAEGAVLTMTQEDALGPADETNCISGAGTLVCDGALPLNRYGLTSGAAAVGETPASGWTGTVKLDNMASGNGLKNLDLSCYGNAASTIELGNLGSDSTDTLYFPSEDRTIASDIVISGTVCIRNGYAVPVYTFTGDFSGGGTLTFPYAARSFSTWKLQGDMSAFTGTINAPARSSTSAVGKIVFCSPKTTRTAFNNGITVADKTTLVVNATYEAPMEVSGTLAGTGTISGDVTFASGATLDATDGSLTVTGKVTQTSALTVKVATDAAVGTTVLTGGAGSTYNPAEIAIADRSEVAAAVEGTNLVLAAAVCSANDTGYASIADALTALGATGGEIIVTAENLALYDTLVINVGSTKGVTLDLNGKYLLAAANPAIRIESGCLTLASSSAASTFASMYGLAASVGVDANGKATEGAALMVGSNATIATPVVGTAEPPVYSNAISVTAGTIGGAGTITGNLTFASGATLDATAGVLTVNGAVTSTSTAITATGYGPVLTAAGVDASTFTTTLADAMVTATDTALYLTKRPSLVVDETETISDTAAALISNALIAEGVYEVEMDTASASADGLELFTNVDLALTVDEADETKGTVKVAYDFGITDVTVQKLTTATTNITAEGTYVVLTVKVDNAEHTAGYGDKTELVISMNGTEVDAANVTVIDNTTIGVMKLAIPYETLEAAELTDSETFIFTVRATNEAE